MINVWWNYGIINSVLENHAANRKIIHHTMLSYLNVAIVKIPFRLRVMDFSNNRLLFLFSWERGFSTGNSGTGEPSTLHHEQTISGEKCTHWLHLW